MVAASLMPSENACMASLIMGIKILLAIKPGASFTTQGILSIFLVKATMVSVTLAAVALLLIISTNFIMGTGFIKCIPITSVGLLVAAAN